MSKDQYIPVHYQCDRCPVVRGSQPALIHHRWEAHQLRGPVKHLKRGGWGDRTPLPPKPPKAPTPEPEPLPVRIIPATFVPSGLPRRPLDHELIRRQSLRATDGLDFEPRCVAS